MVRSGMLGLLAAGAVFFPGLFLVAKGALKHLMGWPEDDAVVLSTRLVSSLQAVLASSAGWIITSSCMDVMEDRHWLTESYILFATPYFAYDVFAMFLCYWYKLQVKGHEEAGPDGRSLRAAVSGFLHREVLMVLHHVFMVAFCFPASLLPLRSSGLKDRRVVRTGTGTGDPRFLLVSLWTTEASSMQSSKMIVLDNLNQLMSHASSCPSRSGGSLTSSIGDVLQLNQSCHRSTVRSNFSRFLWTCVIVSSLSTLGTTKPDLLEELIC
ncbi:hypothetical protein ATANTOWER_010898 [Ataeniobius toweri]|uniref:TLC domain-containing protein n=1 Tax=Ataeniobius toweri TaxID=208326 RepID=A0ABU7B8V6_9TELE|nr:hypothetical protein [Ataeniobius toweri]